MSRSPLGTLPQAMPVFAHLLDRIEAPWRRIGAHEPVSITEAKIDDLAFAIVGWRSPWVHLQEAVAALDELVCLALKAGWHGTDTDVATVVKGRAS